MMSSQLQAMREALEKQSSVAEDLPWYTTAAGATGGILAAQKYLPKKYRAAGQIGGALLGTGLGLEAGKAVSKKLEKKAKVLTQAGRERIKEKNFAIPKGDGPGDTGKYPIHDEQHAKSALTFVRQHGTPAERSKVYAAVGKKYPGLAARSSIESVREKSKKAEAGEPMPPHPALTAAKTIGGLGVGMLAGYGGMKATDEILKKVRGRGLPRGSALTWAVPLAAGAGGLAYSHLQQRTLEKMRQDHLKRQEKKSGSKSS